MKFNEIIRSKQDFDTHILTPLNVLFPNAEWLNETNSLMNYNTLYMVLNLYYGDRRVRYDTKQAFLNKFIFTLADILPDIYTKQLVFVKQELVNYLSSANNRAIKIQGGHTSSKDQRSNTKSGTSTTPTNLTITDPNDIQNLPLNGASINGIQVLDNYNSSNEQTNLNFIGDMIKQLNSDFSLRIQEFVNMLEKHFQSIQTSGPSQDPTDLYCGTRFMNGYYLNEVNYLGIENQEQIKALSGKVQANKNDIDSIKANINGIPNMDEVKGLKDLIDTKQDKLTQSQLDSLNNINQVGEAIASNTKDIAKINNYVQENGVKISDLEQSQEQQNTLIASNTTQITTNKNELNELYNQVLNKTQDNNKLIQDVIKGMAELKPFEYVGEYDPNTLYRINQLVSSQGTLFLSKINDNNYPPPNDKYWLIINSPLNVDLSQYYDKPTINQMLNNYFNLTTSNIVQEQATFNKGIALPTTPTNDNQATNKSYVDTKIAKGLKDLKDEMNHKLRVVDQFIEKLPILERIVSQTMIAYCMFQDNHLSIKFKTLDGTPIRINKVTLNIKGIGRYTDVGSDTNGLNTGFLNATWVYDSTSSVSQSLGQLGEYTSFPVSYKWINVGIDVTYNGSSFTGRFTCLNNDWRDFDYLGSRYTGILLEKQ